MIVGVNDIGLHVIQKDTKQMQHSFRYDQIDWVLKKDDPSVEVKIRANGRILLFKTKQVSPKILLFYRYFIQLQAAVAKLAFLGHSLRKRYSTHLSETQA